MFILNLSPFGFIIVGIILVGVFFDAVSNMKDQFSRFAVWGIGQGLAIILSWPWAQQNFAFGDISFLNLGDALASAPQRFTEIFALFSSQLIYLVPIMLGLILASRTLVQATPFNTDKPILIGTTLFMSATIPLIFFLLLPSLNPEQNTIPLIMAAFSTLIIIAGIGLAYLSTRVPFHASFFVTLFAVTSFVSSPSSSRPALDLQAALQHYNSSEMRSPCVIIFPEKYQYPILYGIEKRPECVVSATDEIDVTPQSVKEQNATLFFFPKASGDGSSLRRVLQNFPQTQWQIEPRSFSGVLVIQLTRL